MTAMQLNVALLPVRKTKGWEAEKQHNLRLQSLLTKIEEEGYFKWEWLG